MGGWWDSQKKTVKTVSCARTPLRVFFCEFLVWVPLPIIRYRVNFAGLGRAHGRGAQVVTQSLRLDPCLRNWKLNGAVKGVGVGFMW